MKHHLAIFGGSGGTGTHVCLQAMARGWSVTGLVRTAGSLPSGTQEVVGDLVDLEAVSRTLEAATIVIIVFGARPPFTDVFCAAATSNIVTAAKAQNVDRIIVQTGGLVGDYQNQGWVFKTAATVFARGAEASMADRAEQEQVVKTSGLRWTLVKPPRLTDGESTDVAVGTDVRVGLFSSVSRASLANVLLDLCDDASSVGSVLFVKKA